MTAPVDRSTDLSGVDCCEEFARVGANLRRRTFLGTAAAVGAGAVTTGLFGDTLMQAAHGVPGTTGGKTVVLIALRGGLDGVGTVVPHGDPHYYKSRGGLGVPREQLWGRDQFFGFHPALRPLTWLWRRGELAAVHAVGLDHPNRSHFEAMEEIEDADPTSSVRRGWVNRMVGLNGDPGATDAIHLGEQIDPTLVVGPAPHLSTETLTRLTLPGVSSEAGDTTLSRRRRQQLSLVWQNAPGPLGEGARSALGVTDAIGPDVATAAPRRGATYPSEGPGVDLGRALTDAARLIRADVGTEVISIDYGTWDFHSDYGTVGAGKMTSQLAGFAAALDAFLRDLGERREDVTVVTISEFGRKLHANGGGGLDHGWGNVMLLAGGGVKGGRYYGRWPGLGRTHRRTLDDLAVTTDYRDVLAEVIATRFPARTVPKIFPGHRYRPLGVMRPSQT